MNIETSNLNKTKDTQNAGTNVQQKNNPAGVNFADELKDIEKKNEGNVQNSEEQQNVSELQNDKEKSVDSIENKENLKDIKTDNDKKNDNLGIIKKSEKKVKASNHMKSMEGEKLELEKVVVKELGQLKQTPKLEENDAVQSKQTHKVAPLEIEPPKNKELHKEGDLNLHTKADLKNKFSEKQNSKVEIKNESSASDVSNEKYGKIESLKLKEESSKNPFAEQLKNNKLKAKKNVEKEDVAKEKLPNIEQKVTETLEFLHDVVKEINQKDDKTLTSIKEKKDLTDNKQVINNDFNIQENKDLLPQMNPGMTFSGDGQPFSSFMNNQENDSQKSSKKLNSTAQELAEEAAILSTMAENIAIANKNNMLKDTEKTVVRNDGVKKVNVKTGITVENVVKFDSIIMNQADVEVFANLVENNEVNMQNLAPKAAEKAINVSKALADMLVKSMENNQPLRIDFDNNISVIIRISREGKISAEFLPSSQVAEAYLKENLPLLRQRFEDNNISYDELNHRERREQNKENNRKKGRNDE